MQFTVVDEAGDEIPFECADSFESRWTCNAILEGRTYPLLPFIGDVEVALDVGANCGAMTLHLARHHPNATIHAFEPGVEARQFLHENLHGRDNVAIHPFGLSDADRSALLYLDPEDLGRSSVIEPTQHQTPEQPNEAVDLRAAGPWARQEGVEHIDILKVDVEGCEVEVIESLGSLVGGTKVIYVEYDGRASRRRLAELIESTHELFLGTFLTLDQGECVYLRSDLADHPDATTRLREIFTRSFTGSPGATHL